MGQNILYNQTHFDGIQSMMQEEPRKADWMSFVMHFVIGLFPGCLLGYATIHRHRRGIWLDDDLIFPYLLGTSLIIAGIAATYGDRLWIGHNYRVIPPDAVSHSKISLYVARITIIFGAALAFYALYKHFNG
jgi:hypothetical protein